MNLLRGPVKSFKWLAKSACFASQSVAYKPHETSMEALSQQIWVYFLPFQQTWACVFFYQKWWPLSKLWVEHSFSKWLAKWMAPILQAKLTLASGYALTTLRTFAMHLGNKPILALCWAGQIFN